MVTAIGIGGLGLLAVAILVAIFVGRRLGRPMLALAKVASRVEVLDFSGAAGLPRGPVREINQAVGAVERMAGGLAWFETYLPRTLVRRLMAAGPDVRLSEMRDVTVMFTDLESYSQFSLELPANDVVNYLNELLSRIGPIIEEGGGTIDKYIGDSVMAFWGAPDERSDHAAAACHVAMAIAREVEAFNVGRRAQGQHACRMRIGLHTGPVAVGNVGFDGRMDYTIIGQTVNVAQAIEQAGRGVVGIREAVVLVSAATADGAGPAFAFEPHKGLIVDDVTQTFQLS